MSASPAVVHSFLGDESDKENMLGEEGVCVGGWGVGGGGGRGGGEGDGKGG